MSDNIRKEIILGIHKSNLSIPEIAKRCSINKGTLYKYVKGESELTFMNMQKILDFLHIKVTL